MEVLPLEALPIGYRFNPTDEQLIDHFLRSKITGNEDAVRFIREVDLCKCEPWELPGMSLIPTNDDEWIFFCPKDPKNRKGKRSNRSTKKGFWKATGNDRPIKSGNGTTKIGTKKSLVFHTGRAPKGKRTNWVIHEYCATSKELDGSNPGQGSFFLFKLIKKHDNKLERNQDESTEGLNFDEVEENVSSPATVVSFMPSEPVTPTVHAQVENLLSSSKSCLAQNYESFHDSYVADDLEYDPEVSRHLVDLEQPDSLAKIFSPLHSQMQPNLESMHNLHWPFSNDVGDHGPTEQGSTEYFASVPSEAPLYNYLLLLVSNSDSDAEAAQEQVDPEQFEPNNERTANVFMATSVEAYRTPDIYISNDEQQSPEGSSSNSDSIGHGDTFGTGINLRTRQPRDQSSLKNFGPHGNAPRRIQLQQKLQLPSFFYSKFTGLSFEEENHEAKLVAAKAEEAGEKLSATDDPAAVIDASLSKSNQEHLSDQSCELFNSPEGSSNAVSNGDTFGTGIKLKTCLTRNQPSSKSLRQQGNAPRKVFRLKKKLQVPSFYRSNFRDLSYKEQNHEAELVVAKAEEKESVSADPAAIVDEGQDTSLTKSNNVTKLLKNRLGM
ncbi:hypothetical protein CsSME_00029475 [Camellia sinensis var. sinensis]